MCHCLIYYNWCILCVYTFEVVVLLLYGNVLLQRRSFKFHAVFYFVVLLNKFQLIVVLNSSAEVGPVFVTIFLYYYYYYY